jgi:hypothetical protein
MVLTVLFALLDIGLKDDPTNARPTKTMNCIVLQTRSYSESLANLTS